MDGIKMKSAALANSLLKLIEKKDGAVGNRGTGDHGSSVWDELTYEKQKYLDDSFNILFAGEIKTGKSSLVNNLLGLDVCTVAPGVCTNVNTVIHYGSEERITVHFNPDKDGSVPEPQTIS
jgi:ribosome biogenesis GTPase A